MAPQKTVLVTGGAGYIGSHACKALHSAGYMPVTADNLSHGFLEAVRWGPFEQADICDALRLEKVFTRYKPSAVLHFAGLISVAESVSNPEIYHHNNVTGTATLLGAMQQAGVRHLVFSSSCAVHGNPAKIPIQEDDASAPVNPYGQSKWAAEQAIREAVGTWGLNAAVLRYFNAAGADPEGEIGERHDPETHIIPLAIRAALTGQPFHIFGTDYPTPDGTAIRDYIHVSDLADAHVLALEHLFTKGGTLTLNLGTGTGTSVRQVAQEVEKVAGKRLRVEASPRRAGDPSILVADAARAKKMLNFVPKQSSIDSIVQSAWNWHTRN